MSVLPEDEDMGEPRLNYATPPPRPARGWQFLAVAAMVAVGVLALGLVKFAIRSRAVPPPTTSPSYSSTSAW
jgi:hypothetical protein